jgi:hypothetical protein
VRRLALAALVALAIAAPAHAAGGLSYGLTMTPRETLFGDPVTAQVAVVVDRARVSPASVRVHADFRPYRVESSTIVRARAGDLTRVLYTWRLDCLERKCLPGAPERRVKFAPMAVTWSGGTEIAFWSPLRVASRLDPRDLLRPAPRSDVIRQPPLTYAVSPAALVSALVVLAVLLLAYPAVRLARVVAQLLYDVRTSRFERLSPMQRALELLRLASAGGEDASCRRALERVARELGDHELSGETRRLAWSRPNPETGEIDSLRTRVEDR